MNERIKLFAEQAKAQYCDLSDASCFKQLGLVEAVVFKPEDLEGFAQLIVRECAEMVRIQNEQFMANESHYGVVSADILKHFGVEE